MRNPGLKKLSAAFICAGITAAQFSCVNPRSVNGFYARLADPETKLKNDLLSITVASDRLFSLPLSGDVVHNFIVFKNIIDDELFCLHGFCIDRDTHKMAGLGDNSDALLIYCNDDANKKIRTRVYAEADIFCGPFEEIMRKYMVALDAAHFINSQNLVYDLLEPFGRAQNSNSVASTLVEAMGLSFPPEIAAQWAPGHGRSLLPPGWKSYYADCEFPSDDPVFLFWYAEEMATKISADRMAMLESNMKPDPSRAKFYSADAPGYSAYKPLLVEDAMERFTAWKAGVDSKGYVSVNEAIPAEQKDWPAP